jgi:hypothetical protein
MSRSHRKIPKRGWASADSDKPGKVAAHRQYRNYANGLANEYTWDFINNRKHKENPYNYPKDGKTYWPEKAKDYKWIGK